MIEWLYAAIIVLLAATLQAVTGFGFAITATPLLLLLYNSREAIQISIYLSFFIAVILLPRIRQKIDYGLFRRLVAGSIPGVPLGLWIYLFINLDSLKVIISGIILGVTIFSLYGQYKKRAGKNNNAIRQKHNSRWELAAGIISGILAASIGMPGVPLALYFIANNTDKEVARSTTLAFFGIVYTVTFVAQAVTGSVEADAIFATLMLAPVTAAGVFLGHSIFPLVRQGLFQVITNVILIYTAIYMLTKVH
ncbi:MAG: sulfite exporter TauE/SafE family protein [Sporomusaceae bacterium]|nr:sulfite exporter TauE/SafE family protein [Sporomusaceae bacterium]